jgi:hypothetical protein
MISRAPVQAILSRRAGPVANAPSTSIAVSSTKTVIRGTFELPGPRSSQILVKARALR